MNDIAALRSLFRHCPSTGKIYWHFGLPRRLRWGGKLAFNSINGNGYFAGTINGKSLLAHRVIWALHYGHWPVGVIDHINRNRTDNRIENLRDTDVSTNNLNRTMPPWRAAPGKGVIWCKNRQVWTVQFNRNGKKRWGGRFSDLAEAKRVAAAMEAKGF